MNRKVIIVLAIFFLTVVSSRMRRNKRLCHGLVFYTGSPGDANIELFLQGLRELGYLDGKNILIEIRYAQGDQKRSAELAKELVQLNVDALFTSGTRAILERQASDESHSDCHGQH